MEPQLTRIPQFILKVPSEKAGFFNLLLQSGVFIAAKPGTTIGQFLEALPGFSIEYIINDVQTIFLNGTATDDLETHLEGREPVLAISAAMPGLAGAIFRKNSLHATLRSKSNRVNQNTDAGTVNVLLKLFNAIARDRGSELLNKGVVMRAESILQFFDTRSSLLEYIAGIACDEENLSTQRFLEQLASYGNVSLHILAV